MKTTAAVLSLALAVVLTAGQAMAQPRMAVDMKAEKLVSVQEDGKTVHKRVEARDTLPGDVLIYTVSYRNGGNSAATAVSIDGKIPEGTAYVPDTASRPEIVTFSIDQGKTYKKPALLTYEITDANGGKKQVKASPEAYTEIRWVISEIPAGGSGELAYQVRVK
jgi:uncharacterized repeat protein (TIGR01451 family)